MSESCHCHLFMNLDQKNGSYNSRLQTFQMIHLSRIFLDIIDVGDPRPFGSSWVSFISSSYELFVGSSTAMLPSQSSQHS